MADKPSERIVEALQNLANNERVAASVYESFGNSSDARAAKFRADEWQKVVDNAKGRKSE